MFLWFFLLNFGTETTEEEEGNHIFDSNIWFCCHQKVLNRKSHDCGCDPVWTVDLGAACRLADASQRRHVVLLPVKETQLTDDVSSELHHLDLKCAAFTFVPAVLRLKLVPLRFLWILVWTNLRSHQFQGRVINRGRCRKQPATFF